MAALEVAGPLGQVRRGLRGLLGQSLGSGLVLVQPCLEFASEGARARRRGPGAWPTMTRVSVGERVLVVVLGARSAEPCLKPRRAAGRAWMASTIPKAGSVRRMDPAISSQVAPTSAARRAWRCTPPGWRAMTVHTMRMSSWVLRSGARRESMEAIQAFWAWRTPGAHSCRNFSDGKGQTSSSTSMSSARRIAGGAHGGVTLPAPL